MIKNLLIIVSIIAGLMLAVIAYMWASNINKEKIQQAKLEMQQMRSSRDSIRAIISYKDSLQTMMQAQVSQFQTETGRLRNQVDELERKREQQQLSVRSIRKKEDLQQRLKKTFPEMAQSDWGVTEVMNNEQGVSLEYLLIPLWFSETFIEDHQNSISFKTQRNKMFMVDSLQQQVGTLKDSLLVLEQQKANAYKSGYQDAFGKYEALNEDYIRVLKKPPRIAWGLPQWGSIAAGIGAGILLGTQIK